MADTLKDLCDEFWQTARDVYIFYLDAFKGLELIREDMLLKQAAIIKDQARTDPLHATIECTDENTLVPHIKQLEGPTELSGLVGTTLAQFKMRNAENGLNFQLLGNLCLAVIYAWWEDHYREQFAAHLHTTKNEIKLPILGDVCRLRNAIIHNRGIATEAVENSEVLKWFKRGDPILITFERFEAIMDELQRGLQVFYQKSLFIGGK